MAPSACSIETAVNRILECQTSDCFWESSSCPHDDEVLESRHRMIYTAQVLRFLGETGRSDLEQAAAGADYLYEAKGGAALFDSGIKIPALQAMSQTGRAEQCLMSLLREVHDPTGAVELGRQRQAGIFDALFTLEAVTCSWQNNLEAVVAPKRDLVVSYVRRNALERYKLSSSVALWAWYLALEQRLGSSISSHVMSRFTGDLLAVRNASRCWSPPKSADRPKAVGEIVGDALETAHVLVNLVELEARIPEAAADEVLMQPLEWIVQDYVDSDGWANSDGKINPYLVSLLMRLLVRAAVLPGRARVREAAHGWLGIESAEQYEQRVRDAVAWERRIGVARRVFIVHGHDHAAKFGLARLLENRFGLEAVILHEQANYGSLSIFDKFERYAAGCEAAFILLTPDDVSVDPTAGDRSELLRARQNVIFEMGYFTAKLGRDRVFLLHKGPVEIPSDLSGILYIDFDDIEDAYLPIERELKELGLA